MLANYDAKAIAEVMGIGLVRAGTRGARETKPVDCITVDHDLVRVMDHAARGALRISPALLEKVVAAGLPRAALRHVAEHLAGDDKARVQALERDIVPKTTLERRTAQLSPAESERTERIARLFVHARRALGSAAEARAFMTQPHPLLDGRSPMDAARTDLGTRRAEQILNALEYGLAL